MERLEDVVERLDGRLDDAATLAGNLRDLRRVNRWLGGIAISAKALDALVADRRDLSMIDIGTGSADIPVAIAREMARHGRRVQAIGLDERPEILEVASAWLAGLDDSPPVELRLGDGLALPFADRSFDVAHASLVTHHLDPTQAIDMFTEMGRVAREGIVVNDLIRSRPAWLGALLLTRLTTRNPYTRHDAPLSVRRAYRRVELTAMLATAGFVPVRTFRGLAGHRVAIAAVHRPGADQDRPDRSPATP
jgi:ubiquinone/menaquinone biosynthesis C-methylase UbiE